MLAFTQLYAVVYHTQGSEGVPSFFQKKKNQLSPRTIQCFFPSHTFPVMTILLAAFRTASPPPSSDEDASMTSSLAQAEAAPERTRERRREERRRTDRRKEGNRSAAAAGGGGGATWKFEIAFSNFCGVSLHEGKCRFPSSPGCCCGRCRRRWGQRCLSELGIFYCFQGMSY